MVAGRGRESLKELLATNVRLRRHALGWSQEGLADAAGLHRTQVGSIERGEKDVRLGTLEKLAAAFGMAPFELIRPISMA